MLIVLLALGYVFGVLAFEPDALEGPGDFLPVELMLAQAVFLLARHRFPAGVLLAVVALDGLTLVFSSGEVGTGTIAVMVAVYTCVRATSGRRRYLVPAGLAAADVVVTMFAVQSSAVVPPELAPTFAVARTLLVFGLGVGAAEILGGRARLLEALRERAEAAEREKEHRAEEAVLRERTLMARELHDVAAHHLTGIIVSAQAAHALRTSDPEKAGEYIRQVQGAARTTLDNLRQTVGLLRADAEGELAPVASLENLPALVAEASAAGADVVFEESGSPRDLRPLAGIAAYRMVQESLANSLRHAPGAARAVRVDYGPTSVRLTVSNESPRAGAPGAMDKPRSREGYGLIGMAERAALVGATLRTGPDENGGWVNSMVIPDDNTYEDGK
ncbi:MULTISPECIES: sensor histidine kinase [unclassified Arthrobacter]|uniref:sensor histidine kinase n=1 Tax=unclassified Arthrobacter TaxID=235627 RepID=UPI00253FBC55|nr:histidine kinase [Arthrobacter sp. zg.Y919]MCC9145931.1 histidine kinase [Arthrobacter sp. zg-Y919]MDK1277160.1 histidine kinase [Arthrobacter sp. zg.Y919]